MLQPWQLMWVISFAIYAICKSMTWIGAGTPRSKKAMAYLLFWPGLNAQAFIRDEAKPPTDREWTFASIKFSLGLLIFFGLARLIPEEYVDVIAWIGMIGIVFILHFGLFHLISCFWRSRGIQAEPLMNWPILSRNLGEFWGARWNTAFRSLANRFFFRPIIRRLGMKRSWIALLASFLISGIIHDIVISLPAGGGYGGPTAFFALQGLGILLESHFRKTILSGWTGRLYAAIFLILPVGLLFHGTFLRNIIIPFMEATGAI